MFGQERQALTDGYMPEERERIKEWADMGIKGIKPDFFDSQSQEIIQLVGYPDRRKQQRYHLLINIHGAGKPTGERRTYPNAICREAVSGGESCWNDAYFDCMLPFTRFAVGGADFTPMASYGNTFGNKTVTQAHLVAETIMFECGIQTMADKPTVYRAHVAYENLFKNIPTSWEDSILLDGDPGHYVNMARTTGDDWYVSLLANEARTAAFNLDFLDDGATYTAYIFRDSDDPMNDDTSKAIITETMTVTKGQAMSIDLKETGGAVVKLVKTADWNELNAALTEAKSLNSSNYTAASWSAVEAAITAAEQLPETADQATIDAATKAIKDAIANLARRPSNSGSSGSSSSNSGNPMGSDGVVVAVGTGAATAQPRVISDTTIDFTVKSGSAYCFKMTVVNGNNLMPSFHSGQWQCTEDAVCSPDRKRLLLPRMGDWHTWPEHRRLHDLAGPERRQALHGDDWLIASVRCSFVEQKEKPIVICFRRECRRREKALCARERRRASDEAL